MRLRCLPGPGANLRGDAQAMGKKTPLLGGTVDGRLVHLAPVGRRLIIVIAHRVSYTQLQDFALDRGRLGLLGDLFCHGMGKCQNRDLGLFLISL